ncbi:MAG: triosephosphate isomerase, partial [Candidatus Harrisonbacteria bacterium]|nr:triosephosphate isomerase [Candidatus Harrisonbacteria bacterium]
MKLIIANWKMNPTMLEEAVALARATDIEGLVIAPPFPFLEAVGKELKHALLGAQDLFWENPPTGGAFTGEVSADELKALGARYVIVGHSERRKNLGETDEMIAKKMKAASDSGLIPVLCVGESREEHDAGRAKEIVNRELRLGL